MLITGDYSVTHRVFTYETYFDHIENTGSNVLFFLFITPLKYSCLNNLFKKRNLLELIYYKIVGGFCIGISGKNGKKQKYPETEIYFLIETKIYDCLSVSLLMKWQKIKRNG